MKDRTSERIAPSGLAGFLDAPERRFEFDISAETGGHAVVAEPPVEKLAQMKTMTAEGWRFLAHSYAIVNQWQLLAFSRRQDIRLKVTDLPFHARRWQSQQGLFDPATEKLLRSLETADPSRPTDVTLRIAFPLDFSLSASRLTAVFGTLESQIIPRGVLADLEAYERLRRAPPPPEVKALTPSHWSAQGFYKAGFKTEQVIVVPHGVDIGTFHSMPELRSRIRSSINVSDGDFAFFSIGAMSGNKGIDLLLRAFAQVCRKFPHVRLVLKGMDALYKSKPMLLENLKAVPAQDQQRVVDRLIYFGETLSFRKMALLYQAADVYVSSYRAEGFNMPVLEAAACGIPIICTRGGATDDFVTDSFAQRIESNKVSIRREDEDLARLEPNLEHLIALMIATVEDHSWRSQAATEGPRHVRDNYTWDRVVDVLIHKLFN